MVKTKSSKSANPQKLSALDKINNLNPGFKQFLYKTGLFIALFMTIQLILMYFQNIPLPTEYYFILDVDIGKALLLTAMIFFFLSRDKLKKLDKYEFEPGTTIIFGILSILSFVGYFFLKSFLISNPIFAVNNIWLFYPLKELSLILGTLFLAIAVFGIKFSKSFIKKFKKELINSFLIFILALFFIIEFQKLWPYFSFSVAKGAYYLLSLTSQTTLSFSNSTPIISLNSFIVSIGKPCSGIDSMLMFIFLYVFIVGYDWKVLNKKKAMLLFFPGVISVFFLNIIRIYLLLVIGAFVSATFALGFFHTNASMILFLGYFAIFWFLFYKWMKKPEFRKEKNKKEMGFIKKTYGKIIGDSFYRNSLYLMLSTLVMSVLGFIFWMIGARLFTTEQVGLATTIISSMSLITSFSLLGLNTGLIRYLPAAENKDKKINTSFALVAIVTIMISSIFIISIRTISPQLMFVHDNIILAFIFIFFMIFASFNLLIDSIFIAYRSTKFILLKNTIYSFLKILLLFAFVWLGAYGIFSAQMISMIIGFLIVFIILIFKFNYKPKFAFYDSIIRKIGGYSFGNYVAGFIAGLPAMILPLLVLNKLGAEQSAYYYMAMMIAGILFIIPSATSNSLFAEGSHNENRIKHQIKKSIKIIFLLLIPAILFITFLGQYILLMFGKEYSTQGFRFLQLLAVSGIFVGINGIFGTLLRVKNRVKTIIVISIASAILILELSYLLMNNGLGLMGIGYAYLIGNAIITGIYLVSWRK